MTLARPTLDRLTWPRRTERLTLRPLAVDDLPAMFAYRSRPDVSEWLPRHPRAYDEWLLTADGRGFWDRTLVMESGGEMVGDLYLHVTDAWAQAEVAEQARGAQAEIGWTLAPEHRGRGYVTEAAGSLLGACFDDLGLHRVTAIAFADNAASLAVMERLGMRREAYAVGESLHRTRGWLDSVTYALLQEEWLARR